MAVNGHTVTKPVKPSGWTLKSKARENVERRRHTVETAGGQLLQAADCGAVSCPQVSQRKSSSTSGQVKREVRQKEHTLVQPQSGGFSGRALLGSRLSFG